MLMYYGHSILYIPRIYGVGCLFKKNTKQGEGFIFDIHYLLKL